MTHGELSLAELFAHADTIGNRYQTSEEIEANQTLIEEIKSGTPSE